jgi:hypothetical protein
MEREREIRDREKEKEREREKERESFQNYLMIIFFDIFAKVDFCKS